MATQVQFRRGNSTQVAAFTGAVGEIVVNTTNDSVHVNDGATQGGFELARVDGSNWNITNNISTTAEVSIGGITGSASGTLKVKSNSSHHAIALEENSGSEAYSLGVIADGSLVFTNSGSTEVMTLSDDDKVGILRAPRVALDVAGEVAIQHDTNYGLRFYNQPQNNWAFIGNDVTSSSADLRFGDSTGEVMRLSGGNLLVGKTSTSGGIAGCLLAGTGLTRLTADGIAVAEINRLTSDGAIVEFKKDGTTVGSIGSRSSGANLFITFRTEAAGDGCGLTGSNVSLGAILPSDGDGEPVDDHIDLGSSSNRFDALFASSGSVSTSDRNEKQDIELLSDAEMRVAKAAKGLLRKYRWKSRVAEKGDDARIHFGIIAQDLQAAFEAEGLDAASYGMWCSDTWTNDDGSEQTRLGVRYSELLAFIIAAI